MKLAIGIILYEEYTAKYLPFFLPSLIKSCPENTEIFIVDHSEKLDNNFLYLENNYLNKNIDKVKITYEHVGENSGFSCGYNNLIKKAIGVEAEYFLVTNPDTLFKENSILELVNELESNPKVASVTGKIKRWDFDNNINTDYIDSVGISITKEHRFFDSGQGEEDKGQYDEKREIFGASGALAMLRISALKEIAYKDINNRYEFFDELMFMYKEDVDLAYRLQLAGYKSVYVPKAIIYHDRSLEAKGKGILGIIKGRKGRNKLYKKWSYLNHHIILKKILDNKFSVKVRVRTFLYNIKAFIFILLFEQHLLLERFKLFTLRREIGEKKEQIKVRVDVRECIEKMMID